MWQFTDNETEKTLHVYSSDQALSIPYPAHGRVLAGPNESIRLVGDDLLYPVTLSRGKITVPNPVGVEVVIEPPPSIMLELVTRLFELAGTPR